MPDDEDDIVARVIITCLKKRGKRSKQQLAAAEKEISNLRLETAESTRQLHEARQTIEELSKAKEKANSRLGGNNDTYTSIFLKLVNQ